MTADSTRRWEKRNPEKARELACERTKRWYKRNRKSRLAYSRRWRANNLERARKNSRRRAAKWYRDNRKRALALSRINGKRWRAENKHRHAENGKRWRKANMEKVRVAAKLWKADNPQKVKAMLHCRRARKLGNGGSFTGAEWTALKKFYDNRCLCCGKHERTLSRLHRTLTPDHVRSLAKGGRNDITNIQPLCHGRGGCNNRKGSKHIDYRKAGK